MSAGFAVRAHGLVIAVSADRQEWVAKLRAHLPPGTVPSRSRRVDRRYVVRRAGRLIVVERDGAPLAEVARLAVALEVFGSDLRMQVAEWSPTRVFVHAGVVGWRGRAIVIPGRSFSGKSTLVAALVRAGAVYYSDEYAVLDARGLVHPFPVPLSVRAPGQRARRVPADALGGRVGRRPLPVGLVLLTRHRPGARWNPRPLPIGRAVLEVLAHVVCARTRSRAALETLARALGHAVVLKGVRGSAADVVSRVEGVLETG